MRAAITILACCVAGLLALGLVMLYSSGMAITKVRPHYLYMHMQLIWLGIGLVPFAVAAVMDYRHLRKAAWPLYALCLVLLGLVLIPHVGVMVNGARRWLDFGPLRFQPSELAKIALLVVLAWYCERFQRQMRTWTYGVFIPAVIVGIVLGLIFVEADRGTTVLLAGVTATVLLIAGIRWVCFVPPLVLGAGALLVSILHDPLRMARVMSWLQPDGDNTAAGYQALQARIALGAGGWSGLGLGSGRQKLGFIPEHHTDFILPVIGEELGLIATLLVILAFVAILACGIYISMRASEPFGLYLASGTTFLISFQAFINIGVVTGTLPNKGLPLPFISYGGSNLVMMLTCVGILLSIARHPRAAENLVDGPVQEADEFPSNPFKRHSRVRAAQA